MARPLRIEYPGAFYHITSRGNARAPIYLDDKDRRQWLALFADVCDQYHWRCYAYCQMGNHYHTLVETHEPTLSRGMRQLNGVYAQKFNRRHAKCGHVLQGRYHAVLVQRDCYLLELLRYIVLNPVRAGLVERVGHWPWSGYRSIVSARLDLPWLAVDEVLKLFAPATNQAIARFKRFVAGGLKAPSPWLDLKKEIYLGDDDFVAWAQNQMLSVRRAAGEIPRAQRSKTVLSLKDAFDNATDLNETIKRLYKSGHYTQKQIADYLGVHYATISRRINKE